MNLLIKQDRPADQKYTKLYYVIDEQWTKLAAHDMRSALVNENWKSRVHTQLLHPMSYAPLQIPFITSTNEVTYASGTSIFQEKHLKTSISLLSLER